MRGGAAALPGAGTASPGLPERGHAAAPEAAFAADLRGGRRRPVPGEAVPVPDAILRLSVCGRRGGAARVTGPAFQRRDGLAPRPPPLAGTAGPGLPPCGSVSGLRLGSH